MKVIVKSARLSFNDIFTPKAINGGKPAFSATAICLNGDEEGNPDGFETTVVYQNSEGKKVSAPFDKMQNICDHVAKEKWGKVPAKMKNWAFNKADGSTTRDEYTNEDGEYWAGFSSETEYISAKKHADRCKNEQMTVVDQLKQPIVSNSGLLHSGCFVNLVIDVYAYDNDEGKGITASLEGVQLKKKGEALGFTAIDAADEFDEEEIDDAEDDAADLM
jgi:hypothetical protein